MDLVFTIIMPTLNSEKTIEKSLKSIRNQEFEQKKIEILLCDGGSTDKTLEIGLDFGCKIIRNENKLPEWGKYFGFIEAKGKYIVFMDSDEEFTNKNSLKNRFECFINNKNIKNIICSGLLNPPSFSEINFYSNTVGDPFSFFIYGIEGDNFQKSLKRKYSILLEEENYYLISFNKNSLYPIIDGGTHTFEKEFILNLISDSFSINTIPLIFNLMARKTMALGVMKNDFINHYSSSNIKTYVSKIKWRIEHSIFFPDKSGVGFINREKFLPHFVKIKKIFFIPYSFSIIIPAITGIRLFLEKKKKVFLLHPFITFFTSFYILFCVIAKIFGKKIKTSTSYGNK
ncbi:MAG: glycosyltransferase family 2 protein [Brevinematales bacterium]